MKITDPENVVGKIKIFVEDLELYAKDERQLVEGKPFTDYTNGYYTGKADAYTFCAKWLKAYLEGRA